MNKNPIRKVSGQNQTVSLFLNTAENGHETFLVVLTNTPPPSEIHNFPTYEQAMEKYKELAFQKCKKSVGGIIVSSDTFICEGDDGN